MWTLDEHFVIFRAWKTSKQRKRQKEIVCLYRQVLDTYLFTLFDIFPTLNFFDKGLPTAHPTVPSRPFPVPYPHRPLSLQIEHGWSDKRSRAYNRWKMLWWVGMIVYVRRTMLGKTFSNQFSLFKRIVDTWNASQLSSRALSIYRGVSF